MRNPAPATIYLTKPAPPGEAGSHFTITLLPHTHHAMVTQYKAGTNEVQVKEIVNLGVIVRSIVDVSTRECSSGFLLRAGVHDLPIHFTQINTLRRWLAGCQAAA